MGSSYTASDLSQVERQVQRKFLRFTSRILKIPCPPHEYAPPVANAFGLSSLAERRRVKTIRFIYINNCKIESGEPVSRIFFS